MMLSRGEWMRVLLRVSVYWGDDDMVYLLYVLLRGIGVDCGALE